MRLPPALDDKLTLNAVSMLKYAPLLLLFNAYWMVTNRQIYVNEWHWIAKSTETMISNHFVVYGIHWGTPVLFMVACGVILQILLRLLADSLQRLGYGMARVDINVDEDLPNFF
jgi:hypothetical protein